MLCHCSKHILVGLLSLAALSALAGRALAADEVQGAATTAAAPMSSALKSVGQAQLDAAHSNGKDWLHPNGSYAQTRYYPAAQINTENVAKLKPAFKDSVVKKLACFPRNQASTDSPMMAT